MQVVLVALLSSLMLTSTVGHIMQAEQDRAVQCIRAPCPSQPQSDWAATEEAVPAVEMAPWQQEDQSVEQEAAVPAGITPWTRGAPQAVDDEQEVRQVREERMAQLQLRRQLEAVPAIPDMPLPSTPPHSSYDQDVTDLIVIFDAVQTTEAEEATAADCVSEERAMQSQADWAEGEPEAVRDVVEEEVLIVVAGDRSGHSVLIEMHRLIYHTDQSPCSHFTQPPQQQRDQLDVQPWTTDASPLTASTPQNALPASSTSSLSLVERAILVAVLSAAVLLLLTTVTVACVMRRKQRQQRVLVEPPTVEQLGLDVPMLSSSPSQVLQL